MTEVTPGLSPELAQIETAIQHGSAVEAFLSSELGRVVSQRAEARRAQALERLLTVDPEDARRVRAHQNEIRVIDGALQWLAEAITEAKAALTRLEQMEQGE